MSRVSRLLVSALVVGACSSVVGETPTGSSVNAARDPVSTETTGTTVRDCVRNTAGSGPVAAGSVAANALFLSGELFWCADDVVVVAGDDLNAVATAGQLAAALGGPLLHPHPHLASELGRLKPQRVHLMGEMDVVVPPRAEVVRPTTSEAVEQARLALGVTETVRLPATPDVSTVLETVSAITSRDRVVLPQTDPNLSTATPGVAGLDPLALIRGLAAPGEAEVIWLLPAHDPVAVLSAAATGRAIGAGVVTYDLADLLAHPEVGEAVAGRPPEAIRFVGAVPEAWEWELRVLANGVELPGGGFRILPEGEPRRYLAFYGHPETTGLGVLGEQGPQATLERIAPLVEAYSADGHRVIPTFEIIATVASANATEDNDYSFEWPVSTFQQWVDVAAESGAYVIFDLQPGREDFLSQAQQYQELLELPFVGLALDPEWRLKPDQVHLRQVGQVTAAEINTVIDWLADLVRDQGLPQKMLIVHQFQPRMILDRETLKQRPEIQVVIQMDGQGPIPTKDETYAVITEGAEGAHWAWGWKNFFDEDSPTPTPEHTMGKEPVPVFVSYQ